MSVAIQNWHAQPLDVSIISNLSYLTTSCQQQCEIAIVDHQMSVAMWNFYSSLLDGSNNVKFWFFTTRCQ